MLNEWSDRDPEPKFELPLWWWVAVTAFSSFILIDLARMFGVPI